MGRVASDLHPDDGDSWTRCRHQHSASPVSVLDQGAVGEQGEHGRGYRAARRRRVHYENLLGLESGRGTNVPGSELRRATVTAAAQQKKRKPPGNGRLSFLCRGVPRSLLGSGPDEDQTAETVRTLLILRGYPGG